MTKYKLTYFDGRGGAEPIRMAFAAGGVEFEDVRVQIAEWPSLKPKTPQGHLPVLEVNGKTLCQSMAILRYVGKECGFYGKQSWEQGQIDCMVDTLADIWTTHGRVIQEQNPSEQKQLITKHTDESIPKVLGIIEKALKDNSAGKGFLVGSALTIADIRLYCTMDYPLMVYGFKLDKYPKVAAHRKMIEAIPKISEYMKKRPDDKIALELLIPMMKNCRI
ncbi:hypothetical protein ScPMuIL_005063 [Solemya velum]